MLSVPCSVPFGLLDWLVSSGFMGVQLSESVCLDTFVPRSPLYTKLLYPIVSNALLHAIIKILRHRCKMMQSW